MGVSVIYTDHAGLTIYSVTTAVYMRKSLMLIRRTRLPNTHRLLENF